MIPLHPMALASAHANLRVQERFGAAPSGHDWALIVIAITDAILGQSRSAVMVRRDPGGNERWLVSIHGQPVPVVWSRENDRPIVTVLPPQRHRRRTR